MRKVNKKKYASKIIVLLTGLLLIFSVFTLMNHVQYLLNSDAKINLTEIVTQNKDVITSKLSLEMNNLDVAASQMSEYLKREGGVKYLSNAFQDYQSNSLDDRLYIADINGVATFQDGTVIDVAGRNYFRLALEDIPNISDKLVSRVDGREVFIISVPLKYGTTTVGTVQKLYTSDEMYKLCKLSLFSSNGYMNIINSDGYILVSSKDKEYSLESENYYRTIYAQGNKPEATRLERDIKEEKTGFIETTIDGEAIFSAYTPIEGVHDWYLISSIPTIAVSPNSAIVFKMFYMILLFVVAVFAAAMMYYLSLKNRQQAALVKTAYVDPITKGKTFNKFTIDLMDSLKHYPEKQYYLMVLDIDNFKYVNSYYGFDMGDKILQQIDRAIASVLETDEGVGRVSGDHFIVLLNDVCKERLNKVIEAARKNDQGLRIYFTAGVYQIKNREESVNLMMDKASAAARASKDALHKQIEFYNEDYDTQMIHNEQLKREVENALLNNEMIPFFQPKIQVDTGKIVGAEALARWRKSDGKLVPPIEFIPMCEKTGLVVDLDMIIFEKTLQFIRRQLDTGIQCIPISVNFSKIHLINKHFVEELMVLVRKYQIPSSLIELELTESVMLDNHELIMNFIDDVHRNGLKISMDDFGSGYSSLNMLKDVHIDILKIDQVFLQQTKESGRQKIILATIAKMAKDLEIKVVVEGVETSSQVKMMKAVGCDVAQGYYYAKPMDMEAFEKVCKEGKVS